jgi:hypothetical protein
MKQAAKRACMAYPLTLKTSVDVQRTTRRYIPEDRTLHKHHCENLKSYTEVLPVVFEDVAWIYSLYRVQEHDYHEIFVTDM